MIAPKVSASGTLRIACVYGRNHRPDVRLTSMSALRLVRMAQAFARRGHEVDLVRNHYRHSAIIGPGLREIPFGNARWDEYDVVKTFFHVGFDALAATGGADHPCIVSKLGSVVGCEDVPGVYFFGAVRERLYETQLRIAEASRVVTILTNESVELWRREHGEPATLLQVPTGVDAEIPALGPNPYAAAGIDTPVVLFAGNIYKSDQQLEINRIWQDRLNRVGRALRRRGVTLVAIGNGETHLIDREAVVHMGSIDADAVWDWQRHAGAGLVLGQGRIQHNESSKIYYYLRTGLPVVCERGVPNAWLIEKTGHGAIVDYDDVETIAEAAAELARRPPDADGIIDYMVAEHSWDRRAALYEDVFATMMAERRARRRDHG